MPTPTNEIQKLRIDSLGYNFIPSEHLPDGTDEYYLRNEQNKNDCRRFDNLLISDITSFDHLD